MTQFDVMHALQWLALGLGGVLVALAFWALTAISDTPAEGDAFGAGFAALGAFLVGTLGLFSLAFGLAILPSPTDRPDAVLTIRRRQRQVALASLAAFGASLLVPFAVAYLADLATALSAWFVLVALGVALVLVSFVWTVGEAALAQLGVVG